MPTGSVQSGSSASCGIAYSVSPAIRRNRALIEPRIDPLVRHEEVDRRRLAGAIARPSAICSFQALAFHSARLPVEAPQPVAVVVEPGVEIPAPPAKPPQRWYSIFAHSPGNELRRRVAEPRRAARRRLRPPASPRRCRQADSSCSQSGARCPATDRRSRAVRRRPPTSSGRWRRRSRLPQSCRRRRLAHRQRPIGSSVDRVFRLAGT